MSNNDTYDLARVTDEYFIQRMIQNKKHFPAYLNAAKWAWKHLFKNTIFSVQSKWFPIQQGSPFNYIDLPQGGRIFSICITDTCGNMIPLDYNNSVNVIPKPTVNPGKCGCTACGCTGGLCDDIGGMVKTSKLMFTINGVDYNAVTWLKICPNGDILEYRDIPVKKYNTYKGDGGDYNADYSNDYLKSHPPFTDYTIVREQFQRVLCKIAVKPCGCPLNTVDNTALFVQYCSPYCLPFSNCLQNQVSCKQVVNTVNYENCMGSVKVSECGTRAYYIPDSNIISPNMPDYLLVNYQVSGEDCSSVVEVPEFAVDTLFYGIDYNTKRFNATLNFKERASIKYAWVEAQNNLIMYLNPINLDTLAQIQDSQNRW